MSKYIRINKKKYAIQDGLISEWALKELVDKARANTVTMEQMTMQSIAQHWLQHDKFRKSDAGVLNTLLSLAFDFGYDSLKIANGKIKVLALNEERRKEVAPGDMEL